MTDSKYSPLKAIRRATRSMNSAVQKAEASWSVPPIISTTEKSAPCAVLLKSFTDDVMLPDDFNSVGKSGAAIKAYVRPDGAVYQGAFQMQGQPDSVVMVWGDPSMEPDEAERIATMERPALLRRYDSAKLGPFSGVRA